MDSKKLLLIGGVGWAIYHFWNQIAPMIGMAANGPTIIPVNQNTNPTSNQPINSASAVVTSTPPATKVVPINSGNTVTPYNPDSAPAPSSDLYSKLRRYVVTNSAYANGATFDQWNWAASQVGNSISVGIEDVFPGMDHSNILTLDEYWSGLNNMGLAGLSYGLGQIFDSGLFIDFYQSNVMNINGKDYN